LFLKKDAFKDEEKNNENLLVGMYHFCSLNVNKDRILNATLLLEFSLPQVHLDVE